jgi:hypothetical protein
MQGIALINLCRHVLTDQLVPLASYAAARHALPAAEAKRYRRSMWAPSAAWITGAQITCFTGTKVQILTLRALSGADQRCTPEIFNALTDLAVCVLFCTSNSSTLSVLACRSTLLSVFVLFCTRNASRY